MDGTISGEHGIGTNRKDELIYELGENAVDMMRSVGTLMNSYCQMRPIIDHIVDQNRP